MSDLRVVKTKLAIKNAYYKERRSKKLEEIKVVAICENAMINKTTFYKYYKDVYDLANELENQLIKTCISDFTNFDCLFTDTEGFLKGIYSAFYSNKKVLLLFNNRIDVLIDKAEKFVLDAYNDNLDTIEKRILLSLFIRGASYILLNYPCEESIKLNTLVSFATDLISAQLK